MKKRTIIIICAAAICVIAAGTLVLTGVIKLPFLTEKKEEKKTPAYCVSYMDSYVLLDQNGYVIESVTEKPATVPEIRGISFSTIIVGEQINPIDEYAYDYAMKIGDALRKNAITVDAIYISSTLEATMYVGNVKILLGTDNKTEEKLRDLRDFFEDVKTLNGTLDMTELSTNNLGYSFKINPEG